MEATAAEAEGSGAQSRRWSEDHRAGQSSQPVAINRLNDSTQNTYPLGPIMKVKNFRINVVFASSVSVLWALVYVPEGMPIGTLSAAPATTNIARVSTSPSSSSSRAVCTRVRPRIRERMQGR